MNYWIQFDICSVVIIFVELIMFYMKKNIPNLHNKFFVIMMWLVFGIALCDLSLGSYHNGYLKLDNEALSVMVYIFICFCYAIPVLFLVYVLAITERIYGIIKSYRCFFSITNSCCLYDYCDESIF